jgi:N-acetylneuraminic acid mutarotase
MVRPLLLTLLLSLPLYCWELSHAVAQGSATATVPMLPQAIDSFGATEHDGVLYVYGGHSGTQTQQSAKNLSKHFVRCDLRNPTSWEALPFDKPLKDVALVSCDQSLYRIGGAGPTSKADTLSSVSDFARFDPNTNKWSTMPALPAPRSSHDAIAADGKIYVVGGWNMEGEKVADWHDAALMFDASQGDKGRWESLPIPGFRRQGLAVTTWQNCIWAIGGKDDSDTILRTVYYFDPHRGYWSEGPELPTRIEGLQGYGVAAWGLDTGLYVSGADGVLYRLTNMYGEWEAAAELRVQRYCHRLLPEGKTSLLALAGYSVSFGQTSSVERIKVYTP